MKLRKLVLLFMAAILVFAVPGCHKPDDGGTPSDDPYAEIPVAYTPETAEHEDAALSLCFDHGFVKRTQDDTSDSGRATYKMYMGRNEIETFQFALSSGVRKENLSASLSDFTSAAGAVLPAQLFQLRYFNANHKMTPDALCPYTADDAFTLEGASSQSFMVWVETAKDSAAGDYEATLRIRDAAGREVKRAKVFLHVWDFTLSDETACTVSMDLSYYEIARVSGRGDLYDDYYEFMLQNRVSPYNLPYDIVEETDKAAVYLDNPRVRSFIADGYQRAFDAGRVSKIAEILRAHPDWAEKAFFYYVDEPNNDEAMNRIAHHAELLKSVYPEYRMVSPFFTQGTMQSTGEDYLTFLSKYINIWCPKAMLYTTEEDYLTVDNAKPPFVEAWQEEIHGNLHQFMQNQEKGGDTLWWYTCWDPTAPYITLNTEEKGVNHRILFWQQKYFGVKGFLYFSVTEWDAGSDSWTSHEKANSEQNTVWGDGQLIYSGSPLGLDTPVASLRLNSVRDGIEDYEYLTMLERAVGADKVQELISKVTTSVVKYTSDEDFFATYRVRLGNYLESALKGV